MTMPQDSTNALRKLRQVSARPRYDAGAQILRTVAGTDPLRAIVQAVDDTMLPRTLAFSAGPARLVCAVGGRRLRSIIETSGVAAPGEDVFGVELTRDHDALLTRIGEAFGAGARQDAPLVCQRSAPLQDADQGEHGISAQQLAQIWSVSLGETDAPAAPDLQTGDDASTELMALCAAHSEGAIVLAQGVPVWQTGASKAVGKALRGSFALIAPEIDPDAGFVALPGLIENALFVRITMPESQIVLSCAPEALPDILAAWRQCA